MCHVDDFRFVLNELLELATLTPQQVANAFHTLADWQLQFGRDPQGARESLERIAQKFPDTQFSHAADQRIARLGEVASTRDFRENAKFEVQQRERDIGLRQKTEPKPETFDADETAAEYVKQLEAHPALWLQLPTSNGQRPNDFGSWEVGRKSVFSGSVHRRDRPEARGHGWCRRREQRDEQVGHVEAALVGGAEDAGEDLLAVGAVPRAIGAAAHLAGDDRGP